MKKPTIAEAFNKTKQEPKLNQLKKIVELKPSLNDDHSRFTFYIPVDLLKRLKQLSLDKDIPMKDLINNAVKDKYFK